MGSVADGDMMDWEAPQPPLLQLPAELRNKIFQEVLLNDSWIYIFASGVPEPGLLRACKQLRRECAKMFYNENRFAVDTQDYNSNTLLKWTKFYRKLRYNYKVEIKKFGPNSSNQYDPHWENLRVWLRRYYKSTVAIGFSRASQEIQWGGSRAAAVVGGMFEIVRVMKYNEWRHVETLLEDQHAILVSIDPRWK